MKAFATGTALLAAVALAGCWQSGSRGAPGLAQPLPAEQPAVLPATVLAPQTDPPACTEPQVHIVSPQETNADYSKALINVQPAYDMGLTGRCVSVGVIDFGLTSVPHPDLPRDRVDGYSSSDYDDFLLPEHLGPDNEILPLAASDHGTGVTGVIGATADGVGMHGVAPGARVRHLFLTGEGIPGVAVPTAQQLGAAIDETEHVMFRDAMDGVSILNMSWGWDNILQSIPLDHSHFTETLLRMHLPRTLEQFEQADTDDDDKILFVWAAGNDPDMSSPVLTAGLSVRIPELRGHWLSVVSVGEDGTLADLTNRCGIARDNCIAAPGACILTTVAYAPTDQYQVPSNTHDEASGCARYTPHSPLYQRVSGTSLAAPMVSGALALVIERFRGQLGNTAVLRRVLATANKQAPYNDSATYGQGLLDVGAAVQPVGRSSLMLGSQSVALDGLAAGLVDASGLLSLLGSGLRGLEVMVQDELGAPFWHRFEQLPGAVARPFDHHQSQLPPLATDTRLGRSRWRQRIVQHSSLTAGAAPGYALDSRSDRGDSSGVFVGVGMHPGWLMGAYADGGLRVGDFGGHRAFVAPALQQVAAGAVGGGVTLNLGNASWSVALFRGHSAQDAARLTEDNRLITAEYRRDGTRGFWLLQAGVVKEPGSWLGVRSEGSVYGGFGARTGYLNLMGLWAPGSSWQLLGSWYRSGTELQPLAAGLLVSVSQVQSDQLELGVLKRSVLRAGDALGLRWVGSVQRARGVSWQLPIGLYRRQVQYADLTQNLKTDLQQRTEMVYGLPLGRSSKLWLRLGQDQGPATDDYAALSLTLAL